MTNNRFHRACVFGLLLIALVTTASYAQEDEAAVAHAKRILELSLEEEFEEIAAEFNEQMAAAITAEQMKQQWAALRMQFGNFKSFIDQHVTHPADSITVVTLGCRFESAELNFQAAFDKDKKIAGLRLLPRQ